MTFDVTLQVVIPCERATTIRMRTHLFPLTRHVARFHISISSVPVRTCSQIKGPKTHESFFSLAFVMRRNASAGYT